MPTARSKVLIGLALVGALAVLPAAADTSVDAGFGKRVVLSVGKPVRFSDGLALTLTSFSHKEPVPNGPTKATAHLKISKGDKREDDFGLSVHGHLGSNQEELETNEWRGYRLQLVQFKYDESITVIVSLKSK